MMRMPREVPADELAETATASAASNTALRATRAVAPVSLGRYRLERQLGAGGMGVVHAALDIDLERRVAIKLLHAGPSDATRARLLREAKAMARLDHPNVVTIFEVDSIDGVDFVVMELVDGTTLVDWLRAAPRSQLEILDAFVAAGRGLAAAHAAGMVHRDFKPHNVLRSHRGGVHVSDFGLARESDLAPLPSGVPPAGTAAELTPSPLLDLTVSGAVVGTPAYMAPEQWENDAISPAADQFAFCVSLWEALAGDRPFRGDSHDELHAAIERGTAGLDASKIPRRLRAILLRGLARDPAARWPSMDALLAALQRRRMPLVVLIGGAVAALALVTGVALVLTHSTRTETPAPAPAVTAAVDPTLAKIAQVHVPKSHAELIASIHAIDDAHFSVPRATVDQLLLDGTDLAEGARTVPAMRDDVVLGFKLFAIRPRSVYTTFGLHDFDLVQAIDGIPLTSTARLVEIYERIRKDPVVTVDLQRAGTPHRLLITITP